MIALLPNKLRKLAWICFTYVPLQIMYINHRANHIKDCEVTWEGLNGAPSSFYDYYTITWSTIDIALIVGLFFILFTKEKIHDEYLEKLKFTSSGLTLFATSLLALLLRLTGYTRSMDLMMVVLLIMVVYGSIYYVLKALS